MAWKNLTAELAEMFEQEPDVALPAPQEGLRVQRSDSCRVRDWEASMRAAGFVRTRAGGLARWVRAAERRNKAAEQRSRVAAAQTKRDEARRLLAGGLGVRAVARAVGLSPGSVSKLKNGHTQR